MGSELVGHLHGQAGLADAAGTGERHQPGRVAQHDLPGLDDVGVPPDERRTRDRQVGRGRRLRARRHDRLHDVRGQRLEIAVQVACRLVPVGRVLGEAPIEQPLQRQRRFRVHFGQGRMIVSDDGRHLLDVAGPLERATPAQHLVDDDAERELVAAKVHCPARGLLRRHVADRAEDHAGVGRRGVGERLGLRRRCRLRHPLRDPEVEDLHVAVRGQEDVLGLEIAVRDAAGMCRGEAAGKLSRHVDGAAETEGALVERVPKRLPAEELGDQVRHGPLGADVEDGQDVRVIERRGGARLHFESAKTIRVRDELARQHLHRDVASQPRIVALVDLAHPAGAEQADDFIGSDARAWLQGQCGLDGVRVLVYFSRTFRTYAALSATLRNGSWVKLPPCSTK